MEERREKEKALLLESVQIFVDKARTYLASI